MAKTSEKKHVEKKELFEKYGRMDLTGINELAKNLLAEGDIESLRLMAEENGLGDLVELFSSGEAETFADPFTAAVARLTVETKTIEKYEKDIPAEPIVDYLQSRCDDDVIVSEIMDPEKSLADCMAYIRKEAKKIVTKDKPYLADQVVYNMALAYYGGTNEEEKSA